MNTARTAAEAAVAPLIATGVDLREALVRLKAGTTYASQPSGPSTFRFTASDGTRLETLVDVPAAYRPDRPWPVRLQLHGGVSRPASAGDRPLTERPWRPDPGSAREISQAAPEAASATDELRPSCDITKVFMRK